MRSITDRKRSPVPEAVPDAVVGHTSGTAPVAATDGVPEVSDRVTEAGQAAGNAPRLPVRILAVCLGNVCRSPAAEALIRRAAATEGVPVEVESAGTSVRRGGRPANRRMRRAAARWDLELTSRTRELVADDLDAFDLVVVMDSHNLAAVAAMKADHGGRALVRLLRSFDLAATGSDVPDPFRAPVAFHASVLAGMAPAVDGVVEWALRAASPVAT